MAPKTDADWENVEELATQVGPNDRTFVQQPDWQKYLAGQNAEPAETAES
jgi:hypothetical protein